MINRSRKPAFRDAGNLHLPASRSAGTQPYPDWLAQGSASVETDRSIGLSQASAMEFGGGTPVDDRGRITAVAKRGGPHHAYVRI